MAVLSFHKIHSTKINALKYISLYKSKESLSVSVYLKYLCKSGSDWPEILNMAAAWFKGVQGHICLDYNDTVDKVFHKCFTNSASFVNCSHHSYVCTRANHCTQ